MYSWQDKKFVPVPRSSVPIFEQSAKGVITANGYELAKGNDPLVLGRLLIPTENLRYGPAILLPDHRVLILGINKPGKKNLPSDTTGKAQIFDLRTRTIREIASMTSDRMYPSATVLNDGRVLISGVAMVRVDDEGRTIKRRCLKSTEIFDPKTEIFKKGPDMAVGRIRHTSVRLNDGRVLIIGGETGDWDRNSESVFDKGVASVEIYDPKANKFTSAGSLSEVRVQPSAVLLDTGEVLVSGGIDIGSVDSELYQPKTNKFVFSGTMQESKQPSNYFKRILCS